MYLNSNPAISWVTLRYRACWERVKQDTPTRRGTSLKATTLRSRSISRQLKVQAPELRKHYQSGLLSFLKKAQTFSKILHPGLVHIQGVYKHNNTLYMVMDYVEGETLADLLTVVGQVGQTWQKRAFFPIFSGLARIHVAGFIHGNINPSNIKIKQDGSAVLINFAIESADTHPGSQAVYTRLSAGYAPCEQLNASIEDIGPWSDIFSLAATMYHGITGVAPEGAISRSIQLSNDVNDNVMAKAKNSRTQYDKEFLDAIERGLAIDPDLRPHNIHEWLTLFKKNLAYDQSAQQFPILTKRVGSQNVESSQLTIGDESNNTALQGTIDSAEKEYRLSGLGKASGVQTIAEKRTAKSATANVAPKKSHFPELYIMAGVACLGIGIVLLSNFFSKNDEELNIESSNKSTQFESSSQTTEASRQIDQAVQPEVTAVKQDRESVSELNRPSSVVQAPSASAPDLARTSELDSEIASAKTSALDSAPDSAPDSALTSEIDSEINTETTTDDAQALIDETILFNTPLMGDTESLSPRSISELINAEPTYAHIEGLASNVWAGKNCSDCHNWTRENLCAQGQLYISNKDLRIDEIRHPYGGFFKQALKQWAAGQCQ